MNNVNKKADANKEICRSTQHANIISNKHQAHNARRQTTRQQLKVNNNIEYELQFPPSQLQFPPSRVQNLCLSSKILVLVVISPCWLQYPLISGRAGGGVRALARPPERGVLGAAAPWQ